MERTLTVRELAAYLQVSPLTVYRWVERGELPHLRLVKGNIRFRLEDVERHLREKQKALQAVKR